MLHDNPRLHRVLSMLLGCFILLLCSRCAMHTMPTAVAMETSEVWQFEVRHTLTPLQPSNHAPTSSNVPTAALLTIPTPHKIEMEDTTMSFHRQGSALVAVRN